MAYLQVYLYLVKIKLLEVAEKENIPVYLIMKTEQGFETKMSSAFQKLLANKE